MTDEERRAKIAALNDLARTAMGVASRVMMTDGVRALPPEDQSRIREKVETFDAFTPDNDPYGERDFGNFEHAGETVFWKIDYYAPSLEAGSEDPSRSDEDGAGFDDHAGGGILIALTCSSKTRRRMPPCFNWRVCRSFISASAMRGKTGHWKSPRF